MIAENLLPGACFSLLVLAVHFLPTSHANRISPYCSASACGDIHNISFPFRLKDDPKHCGDPIYELACENSVTFLYLNSQKYHVKAINYGNFTIRLADVSIHNNICSFPKYSVYAYNFSGYPYNTERFDTERYEELYSGHVAWPINFVSCQYKLKNSSLFTETSGCANGDNFVDASYSSNRRHTYIKVGHMRASDVKYMCRIDIIAMTSWKFKDFENVSLLEIHDSLLYGFELSWSMFSCRNCNGGLSCPVNEGDSVTCSQDLRAKLYAIWEQITNNSDGPDGQYAAFVLFVLLILGVSLPAKIIIGFACAWGFITVEMHPNFYNTYWHITHLRLIIGLLFAVRLIIVSPCVLWFLIYKFRRRHLSTFDAIEGFLRSDNKLMPIRYSYSDIKKMKRGFREKLGEGGYGSVYKGKLRSGHDVAVKLLGKSGANGRDFMNEIATIGRIHHVNVVPLVGYCAERSKRALVFDFMPNGSLEKYIFSGEKTNALNWKRKFEIAVGVARGIEYLHRGCDIQILHFDIKPHNILLDDKFIPKISDFGLAKFFSTEKDTVTLTAARGTIGYVAPELINRNIGSVSYKADVYSFGMLLMEMVGLNRDLIGNNETSSKYFPCWIYDCFDQGRDIEIIGEVGENENDDNDNAREIAKKMTIVALWCIQMCPDDRPSMNKVVQMLEREVEHLHIPPQPSQSLQVPVNENQTWSTCTTDSVSVSLLGHDAAPSIEITVQDLQSLRH